MRHLVGREKEVTRKKGEKEKRKKEKNGIGKILPAPSLPLHRQKKRLPETRGRKKKGGGAKDMVLETPTLEEAEEEQKEEKTPC